MRKKSITIDGDFNSIGDNLREFRKIKGLRMKDLSEKLSEIGIDLDISMISRIETKTRTVSDIELCGLSKVLGIPITVLMDL